MTQLAYVGQSEAGHHYLDSETGDEYLSEEFVGQIVDWAPPGPEYVGADRTNPATPGAAPPKGSVVMINGQAYSYATAQSYVAALTQPDDGPEASTYMVKGTSTQINGTNASGVWTPNAVQGTPDATSFAQLLLAVQKLGVKYKVLPDPAQVTKSWTTLHAKKAQLVQAGITLAKVQQALASPQAAPTSGATSAQKQGTQIGQQLGSTLGQLGGQALGQAIGGDSGAKLGGQLGGALGGLGGGAAGAAITSGYFDQPRYENIEEYYPAE